MAYVASLFPLRVLYLLSDLLAPLVCSVVRYRRRVVDSNLAGCFPGLDTQGLRGLRRGFYRFLCDYFMETVKMTTMSEGQMRRRMRFENVDLINDAVAEGRSVGIYLGHYGNWEWVSSLPLHLDRRAEGIQLYHPLENFGMDRFFLKIRGRFGGVSVSMTDSLRHIVGTVRGGRPTVTGYIADQVPGYHSIHLWVDFLRRDTPVFSGPERISRAIGARMVYGDVFRDGRGRYRCVFREVCDDASRMDRFEPTHRYFGMLESTIERDPSCWLWSHRRWKRTRERFDELFASGREGDRLSRL